MCVTHGGHTLFDPTRFELPSDESAQDRLEFLVRLYGWYIGRLAANWRGGNTLRALHTLDDDEPLTQTLKAVMHLGATA